MLVVLSTMSGSAFGLLAARDVAGAELAWVSGADECDGSEPADEDEVGVWVGVPVALPVLLLVGCRNARIATTSTTTPRIASRTPAVCSRRRRAR
jgi:hypothetical protein